MNSKKIINYLIFSLTITFVLTPIFFVSADESIKVVSWKRRYDYFGYCDVPLSVTSTSDGGFIIIGKAQEMAGCSYILIKTDSKGELVWSASWGGDFHVYCIGECAYEIEGQDYIFLGQKIYAPNGDKPSSFFEIYKLNKEGIIIWSTSCNISDDIFEYYFYVSNEESYKITKNYLIKLNSEKKELWKTSRIGSLFEKTFDGKIVKLDKEYESKISERFYIISTKYFYIYPKMFTNMK